MSGHVLITGGSRGIGGATAKLAAASGHRVCINYRQNREAAARVVDEIRASGGDAMAVRADVGDASQVVELFDEAARRFGPVTALVNNAAVLERQAAFVDIEPKRFERILRTNLLGVFLCAREAVRRMSVSRGGDGGAIVNVSSVAARTGSPNEYVDYAASKGAVETLSRGLAREVAAEGIRVNVVRPGFIHTSMHADGGEPDRVERLAGQVPLQRGGEPVEVAKAIVWLLSDEAAYVVGAEIDVSGGV